MNRVLAALLGSGTYTPVFYELNGSKSSRTPFVVEALQEIQTRVDCAFSEIILFGTAESSWSHLLKRSLETCEQYGQHEPSARQVWDRWSIASSSDPRPREDWKVVEDVVGRAMSIHSPCTARCRIIPAPRDSEGFTEMLQAIINEIPTGSQVSFDVTHGLRSQAFFMAIAVNLIRTLRRDITLDAIYYGALDQMHPNQYGGNVVPIIDMNPAVETLDWTHAASAYRASGNPAALEGLVPGLDEDSGLSRLGVALSFNLEKEITAAANDTYEFLIRQNLGTAGELFRESLLALPSQLRGISDSWQRMLELAKYHHTHGRYASAAQALWEGLKVRFEADLPGLAGTTGAASAVACNYGRQIRGREDLEGFFGNARSLNRMRNAGAHLGSGQGRDNEWKRYPGQLSHFLHYYESDNASRAIEEVVRQWRDNPEWLRALRA